MRNKEKNNTYKDDLRINNEERIREVSLLFFIIFLNFLVRKTKKYRKK